jgi:hypothetical protein
MSVRTCVSALSAVALLLAGQHCQSEPEEEAPPAAEAEPMEEAPPPPGVSDTVRAGETFELAWPSDASSLACIEIPADAVAAGTVVTISPVAGMPGPISEYCGRGGHTCYHPIIDFSASPAVTITGPDSFRVGICARYNEQAADPADPPGATAVVAHLVSSTEEIETLPRDSSPCTCPGPQAVQQSGLGPVDALLAGSLLRPAPLHAAAVAYEGLGGKGGSLSPFFVVRPAPSGQ